MKISLCLPILGFCLLLTSCGTYTTNHVRDYRIYVDSSDDEVRETVRVLADDYNEQFGGQALTIVNTEEESNSSISFINGLKERENKLGLGQWITVTSEEGQNLLPTSGDSQLEKTVLYSMEIDFDLGNFKSKMDSRDSKNDGAWKHLYHLFCHEVGHGLQMGHEKYKTSVMYKSIPDNSRDGVRYDSYFRNAREFFRN